MASRLRVQNNSGQYVIPTCISSLNYFECDSAISCGGSKLDYIPHKRVLSKMSTYSISGTKTLMSQYTENWEYDIYLTLQYDLTGATKTNLVGVQLLAYSTVDTNGFHIRFYNDSSNLHFDLSFQDGTFYVSTGTSFLQTTHIAQLSISTTKLSAYQTVYAYIYIDNDGTGRGYLKYSGHSTVDFTLNTSYITTYQYADDTVTQTSTNARGGVISYVNSVLPRA